MFDGKRSESSKTIKARVETVREIQRKRFTGEDRVYTNAAMSNSQLSCHCKLDQKGEKLLEAAFKKLGLSARASTRILKVARTIADMEEKPSIESDHIAEAIQYRSLDRKYKPA